MYAPNGWANYIMSCLLASNIATNESCLTATLYWRPNFMLNWATNRPLTLERHRLRPVDTGRTYRYCQHSNSSILNFPFTVSDYTLYGMDCCLMLIDTRVSKNSIPFMSCIEFEYVTDFFLLSIVIDSKGGLVAQAVSRSPPIAGFPSSRLGHFMWVSWWTKRGLGRFFSGFLPFSPTTNSIPPFLHTHLIHFVSFHPPLWWCDRRGRPAPLLFTDLHYRGFIASHPSTRPCVGHELRIYKCEKQIMSTLIRWRHRRGIATLPCCCILLVTRYWFLRDDM